MPDEDLIPIVIALPTASGREAIATAYVPRGELSRTLKVAFFNRAGKPVRGFDSEMRYDAARGRSYPTGNLRLLEASPYGGGALVYTGSVPKHSIVSANGKPIPIAWEGPDVPVYAIAHTGPARRIGITIATEVAPDVWRSKFTPDADEFVTHFVVGKEGGQIEYAGVFDEPVVLWKGHALVIGVRNGEAIEGKLTRPGTYSNSRGIRTRTVAGHVSARRDAAGSHSRHDQPSDLARSDARTLDEPDRRRRITDPRRLLPAARV